MRFTPSKESPWIPVESKLPKYKDDVSIMENVYLGLIELNAKHSYHSENLRCVKIIRMNWNQKWYGHDQTGEGGPYWRERIIAWMPLPEVYSNREKLSMFIKDSKKERGLR